MAQKIINLGSSPNDNTGDSLRHGGDKINDNFTELYASKNSVEEDLPEKTNKGGYSGTTQDLKDYIDSLSFDGAITYDAESDLPISPIPSEGTTAKVGNDPDPEKNGNWYVSSGVWVQASQNNKVTDIDGLTEKLGRSRVNQTESAICIYGIDSLTDGSSGETYREFFDPVWRGAHNKSELGFIWLNLADTAWNGMSFGTNLTSMINAPDFSVAPIKYSLSGKGLYQLSGTGGYINLSSGNSHYDKYRLYYLQQPGGGTFGAGFSNTTTGELITVDTDGELDIKYVEVVRNFSDTSTASAKSINGNCAFFCIKFMIDGQDSSTCNIATGGMKMEKIKDLDSSFRQKWYEEINPAVLLFNAGANDQATADKATFKGWLETYIDDVQAANTNCNIVMVQPNQTSAWDTTFAPEHYQARKELAIEKDIDFFDTIKIIGDYDYFVGNGMMGDGTHPNRKGCRILAEHYLQFLSVQNFGNFLPIPELTTPAGGPENKTEGVISPYSDSGQVASTEYTAFTIGMYSGYSLVFVELIALFRLQGASYMNMKRIKFTINSGTTYGDVTSIGDVMIEDVYRNPESTGTVPNPTVTVSLEGYRAVVKYTSDVNLASASFTGKWQMANTVLTDKDIIFTE